MAKTDPLREHLLELLGKGGAHADFDKAVSGFPAKLRGVKPAGSPHTGWRLVEHLRIAQADILAFSRDAYYQAPSWPDDYWPAEDAPSTAAAWTASIKAFRDDRKAIIAMVKDRKTDLLMPFPHGQGQTLAREAMLVADHSAYHIGQLILLRQVLGCWED